MQVQIFDYTPDAEYKIGYAAAECYDAKVDRESCLRRAKKCKDDGHLATLRFAYATFKISGISRVCSHQLVRHAHLSYLQRSQRYVVEKNLNFVEPVVLDSIDPSFKEVWNNIQKLSEKLYLDLIETKQMKKEDARFILPQGCDTSIYVTGNLQAWLDFVRLRSDKHAQYEIRQVALEVQRLLEHHVAPSIFGA